MAQLRPHVDAFFDKVTVNVEDKALRENRLKLLNEIRTATRAVADFSKIEVINHLSPLRGERSPPPFPPRKRGRVGWGRVRGPLREF